MSGVVTRVVLGPTWLKRGGLLHVRDMMCLSGIELEGIAKVTCRLRETASGECSAAVPSSRRASFDRSGCGGPGLRSGSEGLEILRIDGLIFFTGKSMVLLRWETRGEELYDGGESSYCNRRPIMIELT